MKANKQGSTDSDTDGENKAKSWPSKKIIKLECEFSSLFTPMECVQRRFCRRTY